MDDAGQPYIDFSPFNPGFRDDPYPWYRELLARSPGRILVDGVPSVFVARAEHISEVVKDPERFSSAKPKLPGMERVDFFNGMPVMPYVDPPLHTRLRRMAAPAFMPKSLQAFREPAAQRVLELVRSLEGRERADFVKDLADRVGQELLLDMLLSVPREDWGVFLDIVHAQGDLARTPPGGEKPASFDLAWDAGREYCARVIAEKRARPSEDLVGNLVAQGEAALSPDELLAMLLLMFTGGLNTISTHLSAGLLLLLRHPDQAALLRENPELARTATEEILRYDAPNTTTWRFAAQETDIAGVKVSPPMPIYIMNGAANFDEARHEDPWRFDISRRPTMHASFGEGLHFCVGAPIARLASNTLFPDLVTRFPKLALDDADFRPAYEGTPTVRRVKSIPIRPEG